MKTHKNLFCQALRAAVALAEAENPGLPLDIRVHGQSKSGEELLYGECFLTTEIENVFEAIKNCFVYDAEIYANESEEAYSTDHGVRNFECDVPEMY